MFDFRKLRVWQEGQDLAVTVYGHTRSFPREELFSLTSQMRRAAASVPHNIAEGCGRASGPDFLRFVVIAQGSASELESQTLLAERLNFLSAADAASLLNDIIRLRKMLTLLHQQVRKRLAHSPDPASCQAPKFPSPQDPTA